LYSYLFEVTPQIVAKLFIINCTRYRWTHRSCREIILSY